MKKFARLHSWCCAHPETVRLTVDHSIRIMAIGLLIFQLCVQFNLPWAEVALIVWLVLSCCALTVIGLMRLMGLIIYMKPLGPVSKTVAGIGIGLLVLLLCSYLSKWIHG